MTNQFNSYSSLERLEDEEDLADSVRIDEEVAEGKQKVYSLKEFKKKTGVTL